MAGLEGAPVGSPRSWLHNEAINLIALGENRPFEEFLENCNRIETCIGKETLYIHIHYYSSAGMGDCIFTRP